VPIPVFVISGFLGSGKTTLINNVLATAPRDKKIAVLVNELGSISIDSRKLSTNPDNIVDLVGGCVCCGMLTELIAAIQHTLNSIGPDIMIIESTGLALPGEIAQIAVSPFFGGRVEHGAIVTVVGAGSILSDDYPMIREQLKPADLAVLNKIDRVGPDQLARARERILSVLPSGADLIETCFGRIHYDAIFSRTRGGSRTGTEAAKVGGARRDSTAGFAAISLAREAPLPLDRLLKLYEKYGKRIVRSKGYILTESGAVELQYSVDGLDLKDFNKCIQRTDLVLVVKEEDKDLIANELRNVLTGD
jgi:G3E family GTPase